MKTPTPQRCLSILLCFTLLSVLLSVLLVCNNASALDANYTSSVQALTIPQISTAPLNPAFVQYMQERQETENNTYDSSGTITTSALSGDISVNSLSSDTENSISSSDDLFDEHSYSTGLIPSPVDFSYLSPVNMEDLLASDYYSMEFSGIETTGSDLSSYDLREQSGVTAVRDQGQTGSCWAFSTYGSLESYLLHNKSESWDFSENNMKNTLLESYENGFDRSSTDEGGNDLISLAYLARWDGPITESDDPYDDSSTVSPSDAVVSKHVQDVFIYPFVNNSSDICKLMIKDYGAISVAIYFDVSLFFNEENNSYYCYEEDMSMNHAVTLVGWDDNYDRNNFTPAAPDDGAYIVKNSWNDNWGEDGYFYASYYDTSIGLVPDNKYKRYSINYLFTAENVSNYDRIYQYDPLGWCQSVGDSDDSLTGANVFTATSNETLEAVSFYAVDSNSSYNISIYLDPEDGPINLSGPVSVKNGTIPVAGYHTVDLDDTVLLTEGQNFSVVINFTTPGFNYPVAIEQYVPGYSSNFQSEPGQSYTSSDGVNWTDVSASGINICIKAFTTEEKEPQTAFVAGTKYVHVGEEVDFHDTSIFSPDTWQWEFGDSSTSSSQNPSHNYSDTGVYTVSLNASNSYGYNISTRMAFIHVLNSTIVVNSTGSADFTTISEAVNAASDGDTIVVEPGTYSENLYFENDNVSLVSFTGDPADVTIVSPDSSDIVIFIVADNITISNISVVGGARGISLSSSSGCNISNCYVSENVYGLRLRDSVNCILNNNSMENNTYNTDFDSNPNVVGTSNLVDGKPIYYLVNSSDQVINASSNAGVVHLINCSNITVKDLEIENNSVAVYLRDSSNVTISNSTFSGNEYGVYLSSSNDNTVHSCNISDSASNGIVLTGSSSSNLIYNNYFNNSNNVDVSGDGSNYWNTTMVASINIINRSYLGGNYWANPTGTGWSQTEYSVGNGFCAAYEMTDDGNNTDYLPLTENAVQPDSGDSSSGSDNDGVRVKMTTVTSSASNIAATDSSVRFVGNDAEVEYVFTGGETPITGINFESETNEGYVMATVTLLNELPDDSPAPSSVTVYQGMEIVLGDEAFSSGIGNAGISFSVSKQWLESNGFDENDIHMEHFSDGIWNRLSTTVTGEDDEYFYFEATTDGFSPFIICVDVSEESSVMAGSSAESADEGQVLGSEESGIGGSSAMSSVLFASVLIVLLGVVYWKRSK